MQNINIESNHLGSLNETQDIKLSIDHKVSQIQNKIIKGGIKKVRVEVK